MNLDFCDDLVTALDSGSQFNQATKVPRYRATVDWAWRVTTTPRLVMLGRSTRHDGGWGEETDCLFLGR